VKFSKKEDFMTEDQKKRVAAFRFGVISDFVNAAGLEHGERERLLREKCARKWEIPHSGRTRIGRGTIQRWIGLYEAGNGNIESLFPRDRNDRGQSRTVDGETESALIRVRKEFPRATAESLVKIMRERALVTPGTVLNLSNVYRVLHRHNLMRPNAGVPEDRRKFEAQYPNDLWQSDVMHGPRVDFGGKRKKTYLIAIIDDHSRLIPYARFYFSEKLAFWLDTFEKALLRRGLPRKLYVDNGGAFRSRHLEYVAASLGIALIHARAYKPQGKGKIERWFKTVRSRFLPTFAGRTIEELNVAFAAWLEQYHAAKHGSTGQTPFGRFTSHTECLRAAPQNLRDHFRKTARRRVAKDRTITLCGILFEGPVELIGKRVELLWHEDEPETAEIMFGQKSYGPARPVDVNVNYRIKRNKNSDTDMMPAGNEPKYRGGRLWAGGREK
jgi:transposase InsO family protein